MSLSVTSPRSQDAFGSCTGLLSVCVKGKQNTGSSVAVPEGDGDFSKTCARAVYKTYYPELVASNYKTSNGKCYASFGTGRKTNAQYQTCRIEGLPTAAASMHALQLAPDEEASALELDADELEEMTTRGATRRRVRASGAKNALAPEVA